MRVRWGIGVVAALVLGSAILAVRGSVPCEVVAAQPACQVAVAPGPTVDTAELVTVSRAGVHPSGGSFVLTTIAVDDRPALTDWLRAMVSATVDTVPRTQFYPPGTDADELRERNTVAMIDSQLSATIAALEVAGYILEPFGARVVEVADDAVTDAFRADDVITAVDGSQIRASDELARVVRSIPPGRSVTMTVLRDGEEFSVTVELGTADDGSSGYVGLLLTTAIELPVDVDIDAGVIGGPSAGLMFALTILDRLDPVDLTGGTVIAGTGTVDRQGRVAGVGGIRQKLVGATTHDAGDRPAEVFLLPRTNLAEARDAVVARELLLVPVDDVAGAREALLQLADGSMPSEAVVLAPRG